ncbi:TRAP transporter substrate-binding protein DctP [Chloroflexota bacterium]
MKRLLLMSVMVVLLLALSVLPFMAGCAKPAAGPITWKAIQSQPLGHSDFFIWEWYVEQVNERAQGEFMIDIIGGPEAIPIAEQPAAIKDGIVDIGGEYANRVGKIVPPIGLWNQLEIPVAELRERGGFDVLQDAANEQGLYFLGPVSESLAGSTHIYTNKPVDKPQDLAGQRMASYGAMRPWIEALGMTYVAASPTERYTAVERGLADGTVVGDGTAIGFSIVEVADYRIEPGACSPHSIVVANLNSWNSLPEKFQKILTDVALEAEANNAEWWEAYVDQSMKTMSDQGMKTITFTGADAQFLKDQHSKATWADTYEKFPIWAPIVYELFRAK